MDLSVDVKTLIGKFVWHDHTSNDPEEARRFYSELLGWQTEVWKPGEMDYPMIKVGDGMHGGFGKAEGGAPPHWLGHVVIEDVDETARQAEAAGARLLFGPSDIPEVGRFAVIADPQGAVLSLYSPAGDQPPSEGVFVWDELHTTDIDAAKSFYGEILGWTARDESMGDMTYTMFQRAGDVEAAGAMALRPGMEAPPHWLPYIATDSVDASAQKARALGATIHVEPTDIPDVGRFAVIQDPTGAAVGLWQSSSS
jgi:predicted enzyme related to lactoylglutathione lyase